MSPPDGDRRTDAERSLARALEQLQTVVQAQEMAIGELRGRSVEIERQLAQQRQEIAALRRDKQLALASAQGNGPTEE